MMIVGHDENKISRIILSREAFFIFIYMARSLKSFIYIKTTKNNTGKKTLWLAGFSVFAHLGTLGKVPKSRAFTIVQEATPASGWAF